MGRIIYRENTIIGGNNITFIKEINQVKNRRYGLFKCHCGTLFSCKIYVVLSDKKKSCGCSTKHQLAKSSTKHGLHKHPLYNVWGHIKRRCYNTTDKNYMSYGGRGIIVCEEWKNDFKSFYDWAISNGYKKGLTLDRKDNNKGYEPPNCRWVTKTIQSRNQRKRHGTSSNYIGVSSKNGKWQSYVTVNKKFVHIGHFNNEIDAAEARDKYIGDNNLFGFTLNFSNN